MLGIPPVEEERPKLDSAEVGTGDEASPAGPSNAEKPPKPEKPPKAMKPPKPPRAEKPPKPAKPPKPPKAEKPPKPAKPPKPRKPARPGPRTAGVGKRLRHSRRRGRVLVSAALRRPTYGSSVEHLPSRSELPILLNRRGLVGTGAAVGTKKGAFSKAILRAWEGERLISIDQWADAEGDERRAREVLAQYGDRSEIWRVAPMEAAKRVAPRSLDFVLIDTHRDYDRVLQDLQAWFDKVRPGGILAGPDYVDGEFPEGNFTIKRAVDDFFAARGLEVHPSTQPDPEFPSWFVEIPATADGDGRTPDAEAAKSSASGS
jgi:hypothetical protein